MNIDEIIIRKVKKEDAREWYSLNIRVWRDAYKDIFPPEVFIERENRLDERVNAFSDETNNNEMVISYLAEYHGEIIGMMHGKLNSGYEYFKNDYADLVALYVDMRYQGLGVGGKLKKTFEDWARKKGATKYIIGVLKDNKKARMAYEAWGGKLINHEEDFVMLEVGYKEVFYEYNL